MPERTDYWPPERTEAVVKDWRANMSATVIAKRHGLTRNQVIGKIHRLGAKRDDTGAIDTSRKTMGRPPKVYSDLWGVKLTETWAQRKARLARERGRS